MNRSAFIAQVKRQKLWFIVVSIASGFFLYGVLTGTRLLNSSSTNLWRPSGGGMSGTINHK